MRHIRLAVLLPVVLLLGCESEIVENSSGGPVKAPSADVVQQPSPVPSPCTGCPLAPVTFTRVDGQKLPYVREFAADPAMDYVLVVRDDGQKDTGAEIRLNGELVVVRTKLIGWSAGEVRVDIPMNSLNRLTVLPVGRVGARIDVWILTRAYVDGLAAYLTGIDEAPAAIIDSAGNLVIGIAPRVGSGDPRPLSGAVFVGAGSTDTVTIGLDEQGRPQQAFAAGNSYYFADWMDDGTAVSVTVDQVDPSGRTIRSGRFSLPSNLAPAFRGLTAPITPVASSGRSPATYATTAQTQFSLASLSAWSSRIVGTASCLSGIIILRNPQHCASAAVAFGAAASPNNQAIQVTAAWASLAISAVSGPIGIVTFAVTHTLQSITPHRLVTSGGGQVGPVGSQLPRGLDVTVLNQFNQGIKNIPVTFTVATGGGRLENATTAILKTKTRNGGLASTDWTLGPTVGGQLVTVQVGGGLITAFLAQATNIPSPVGSACTPNQRLFYDDFGRTSLGSNWQNQSGSWSITNGLVVGSWPTSSANSQHGNLAYTGSTGNGDWTVEATLPARNGSGVGDAGKLAMYINSNNVLHFNFEANNARAFAQTLLNGIQSVTGGNTNANTVSFLTGPNKIAVKKSGIVYSVYVNGAQVYTITDNAHQGQGTIALGAYGTDEYDDFAICGTPSGTSGSALQLDGIDDYADVPGSAVFDVDALTVEAWVRLDANVSSGQARIANRISTVGGTESWGLQLFPNNEVMFYSGNCARHVNLHTGVNLQVGRWYHLAGVNDGITLLVYIDGVEVGRLASVGAPCKPTGVPIVIGRSGLGPQYHFPGAIDEVRIWGVARSASEIAINRRVRLSGNEPGLAGYWRFDEGSGPTGFDATPWGNRATLRNGAGWTPQTW